MSLILWIICYRKLVHVFLKLLRKDEHDSMCTPITLFLLKESLQNFKRYVICYLDFFIVDGRHLFEEKPFF